MNGSADPNHELLHRRLHAVFGEGEADRRRAAIDELSAWVGPVKGLAQACAEVDDRRPA